MGHAYPMTALSICPSCGDVRHLNDNTGLCHKCSYWRSTMEQLDSPVLSPELLDALDRTEEQPPQRSND